MFNISLDAIDTINSKLGQANAITILLMGDCDSVAPINDELNGFVLRVISDLITDAKKLLREETEKNQKGGENE